MLMDRASERQREQQRAEAASQAGTLRRTAGVGGSRAGHGPDDVHATGVYMAWTLSARRSAARPPASVFARSTRCW